jgi:hypothetical protein
LRNNENVSFLDDDGRSLESLVNNVQQTGVELKPTAMKMGKLLVDGFAGTSADGVKTELGATNLTEGTKKVFWIVQSRQSADEREHLQLERIVSSLRSSSDAVTLPQFQINVREGSGPQQSYEANLRQNISALGVNLSVQRRTKALRIPVTGKPDTLTYYPGTDGAVIRRRVWDLDFEHAPQFSLIEDEHAFVLQGRTTLTSATPVQVVIRQNDGAATDADFKQWQENAGPIRPTSRRFAGQKIKGKVATCGTSAIDTCELYSFSTSKGGRPDVSHLLVELNYATKRSKSRRRILR